MSPPKAKGKAKAAAKPKAKAGPRSAAKAGAKAKPRAAAKAKATKGKSAAANGNGAGSDRAAVIKAAAVTLFSKQGYPPTTMRDIADAVGLLAGSLYVHISSKEDLLFDIADNGIAKFLVACDSKASRQLSPIERLRTAIKEYIRVAAEDIEGTRVTLHQWRYLKGEKRKKVVEKRRRFERIFHSIVQDGIDEGYFNPDINRRAVVLMIIGALNWAPEWFSPGGADTPEYIGDQFADLVLNGMLVQGSGR
jgi:TetR/AcrR family transcriptional regulator, cholesterol catabolism regulator